MVMQDSEDSDAQEMSDKEVLAMELCRMSEERSDGDATIPAKLESLERGNEEASADVLQKDLATTTFARKRTVLSIHSLEQRLNQLIRALYEQKSEKETAGREYWKMWDEAILFAGSVVQLKRQTEAAKENGGVSNQVVSDSKRCAIVDDPLPVAFV